MANELKSLNSNGLNFWSVSIVTCAVGTLLLSPFVHELRRVDFATTVFVGAFIGAVTAWPQMWRTSAIITSSSMVVILMLGVISVVSDSFSFAGVGYLATLASIACCFDLFAVHLVRISLRRDTYHSAIAVGLIPCLVYWLYVSAFSGIYSAGMISLAPVVAFMALAMLLPVSLAWLIAAIIRERISSNPSS